MERRKGIPKKKQKTENQRIPRRKKNKTVLDRRKEKWEQTQPLVWEGKKWEEEKTGNNLIQSFLHGTENRNTFIRRAEATNTFPALERKGKLSKPWHPRAEEKWGCRIKKQEVRRITGIRKRGLLKRGA